MHKIACWEASAHDCPTKSYGRDPDVATRYKMFNADHDVSMPGRRRLGKTLVLDRLVDAAAERGWIAAKVEVGGCSDTRAFFRELCSKIDHQHSGGERVTDWLRQHFEQLFDPRPDHSGPWYQPLLSLDHEAYFERLIKALNEDQEYRWVVLIAELPIFLKVLHDKGPQGVDAAYDLVVERFSESSAPALRERVARALVNKAYTLEVLGRSKEAIEAYNRVIERFGESSEPARREQVARALAQKGNRLGQLGRIAEAETAFRQAILLATGDAKGSSWNDLGNLLLDRKGDPTAALAAYEMGLATDSTPDLRAILHANCAYTLALHGGDLLRANKHAQQALDASKSISDAGRHLLRTLSCLGDPPSSRWQRVFEQIGMAVASEDARLWSNYIDDRQRLLWFIVGQGEGGALRRWTDEGQYPMRYAPLYHALVAAIDGEDHLLTINPETRQPAARILEGIAKRMKVYPRNR